MVKVRDFATVLAISALVGMTGCSALGIGGSKEQPVAAQPAPPAPAPEAQAQPPQNVEMTRSLVRQVQTSLRSDHLYSGHIDGIWGPKTEHGVSQFQQKNNLPVTGKIDTATLQAMNIGGGENAGMGGGNMNGGNMGGGAGSMNGGNMNGGGMNGGAGGTGGTMGGAAGGTGTGGTTAQ